PGECCVGVSGDGSGRPLWRGQQTPALVVAHRLHVHARLGRKLSDGHLVHAVDSVLRYAPRLKESDDGSCFVTTLDDTWFAPGGGGCRFGRSVVLRGSAGPRNARRRRSVGFAPGSACPLPALF